jgi:hypothetical protein
LFFGFVFRGTKEPVPYSVARRTSRRNAHVRKRLQARGTVRTRARAWSEEQVVDRDTYLVGLTGG